MMAIGDAVYLYIWFNVSCGYRGWSENTLVCIKLSKQEWLIRVRGSFTVVVEAIAEELKSYLHCSKRTGRTSYCVYV